MSSADVMRQIIFSLSGLSLGASAYAAYVHAKMLPRNWKRHTGYLLAKLGYFLTVGEVLKSIIIHADEIPVSADSIVYTAGLLSAALGFSMVALDAKTWKEEADA